MIQKMKLYINNFPKPKQKSCFKCVVPIKQDSIYLEYGGSRYHIECFKDHAGTMLKRWNKEKRILQDCLNKLEPCSKEMICESLEMN